MYWFLFINHFEIQKKTAIRYKVIVHVTEQESNVWPYNSEQVRCLYIYLADSFSGETKGVHDSHTIILTHKSCIKYKEIKRR